MKMKIGAVLLAALLLVMPGVLADYYTAGELLLSDYLEEDDVNYAGSWEVEVKEVKSSSDKCKIRVDDSSFWLDIGEEKLVNDVIVKVKDVTSGMCNIAVNEVDYDVNLYLAVVTYDGRAVDTLTSIDIVQYIDGYDPESEILQLLDNEVDMKQMIQAGLTTFVIEDKALIILGSEAGKEQVRLADDIADLLEDSKRFSKGIDSRIINVNDVWTTDLTEVLEKYFGDDWDYERPEVELVDESRPAYPVDVEMYEYDITAVLEEGESRIFGLVCGEVNVELLLIEDTDDPRAAFIINKEDVGPLKEGMAVVAAHTPVKLYVNNIMTDDYEEYEINSDEEKPETLKIRNGREMVEFSLGCVGIYSDDSRGHEKGIAHRVAALEEEAEPSIGVDAVEPTEDSCYNGCFVKNGVDKCLPFGTRVTIEEVPKYCDIDGDLKSQKEDGTAAENDYECRSNSASYGKCEDVAKQRGILLKMFGWLGKIFGGGDN